MMLFNSNISFLFFCSYEMSFGESWVLKSPTIWGLMLIHIFNSSSILFLKLQAAEFSTNICIDKFSVVYVLDNVMS